MSGSFCSVLSVRFMQVAAYNSSLFFYSPAVFHCTNPSQFIYSPLLTLGGFQLGTVMNKAALNIHLSLGELCIIFPGIRRNSSFIKETHNSHNAAVYKVYKVFVPFYTHITILLPALNG